MSNKKINVDLLIWMADIIHIWCILKYPMAARNTGTEQLIKNTAKKIFLEEGKLHATTEDIAKEAKIPRTSVHYYFRSRDILFKHVFDEALVELTERLNEVIDSSLPFREKIENYIDICFAQSVRYPHLETFIITEIINQRIKVDEEDPARIKKFLKEIKSEMDKGNVPSMNPQQFILNLFSLITYPAIASPLNKKLFMIDDKSYERLLKERKKVIMKVLLP